MLAPSSLHEAIQREIDDPMTGRVGIHVVDLSSGEEVFSHSADQTFLLASLTKIFTVGTAFQILGGDTRFTTRFTSSVPVGADGVLNGNLFIRGGGDPTIGDEKHVADKFDGNGTSIGRLAEALQATGLKRVTGSLVADGSLFVPEGRRRTNWISALTFNRTKFADPVGGAAQAISEELRAAGVRIDVDARDGAAPEDAIEIAAVDSPTVKDLATRAGHESDNFISEVLTKHIGARLAGTGVGTITGGCSAVEEHAASIGADIELWNGSGIISQAGGKITSNEGSPRNVTSYLRALVGHDVEVDVTACLPRAAVDGTLRDRMRNSSAVNNVRAKTGTLIHSPSRKPLQDSLAGYCQVKGTKLAFAIIYERAETRYAARTSLDRVVSALAMYGH